MTGYHFSTESCYDVRCPGSSTCVLDQTNNAYCVTCNRFCLEVTSPEQYLCGNDGIVYASACHLRRATCIMGRSIGVAYEGKCIGENKTKSCACTILLKHVVLITLFSVAITHSCFTWVALTVAAFLRYLIPPQTTLSETRLKLTFNTAECGSKKWFYIK